MIPGNNKQDRQESQAIRSNSPRPDSGSAPYVGSGAGIRLMLYSHDTLGLGHLQRNLKISSALKSAYPELSILLVTGSSQAHRFQLPAGVDYVKLPAVHKVGEEKYESRYPGTSFEHTLSLRTKMIYETTREYLPHLLIVDHAPLGMKRELLPALEWLRRSNDGSVAILGLRDIVDEPAKVIELWRAQRVYDVMRDLYDHILIYGSPIVFDTVSAYEFPPEIKSKSVFCGYITEPPSTDIVEQAEESGFETGRPLVTVTIGGGDGGEIVISNFLEMLQLKQHDIKFDSLILTGPFLKNELWEKFSRAGREVGARVIKYVSSTRSFIQESDLVVSTAGYNTITDILRYASKALVIPRIMYRNEQLIRARRMSELGLFVFMHPEEVTPENLHAAINRLLGDRVSPLATARSENSIHLDGARNLTNFLADVFAGISSVKRTTSW